MGTTGRRPLTWVVEELDLSTKIWLPVHTCTEGGYAAGRAWYEEHGDDEQIYRVVKAYPAHRVIIENGQRRLEPVEPEDF